MRCASISTRSMGGMLAGQLRRRSSLAHPPDVVGNTLKVIASGPTAPDDSTFSAAMEVVHNYWLEEKLPPSVLACLRQGLAGEIPETPKTGDPLFQRVENVLVGSNLLAAQAGVAAAREAGFNTQLLTSDFTGEARHAGRIRPESPTTWPAGCIRSPAGLRHRRRRDNRDCAGEWKRRTQPGTGAVRPSADERDVSGAAGRAGDDGSDGPRTPRERWFRVKPWPAPGAANVAGRIPGAQ